MRRAACIAPLALLAAALPPAGPGPAPAAVAKRPVPRVAVWQIRPLGVAKKEAEPIAAALEAALASLPGIDVVGRAAVAKELKRPALAPLGACDGAPECVAEVGAAVGAASVVFGEIGGLGGTFAVNLSLVDVAKVEVVRSVSGVLESKVDLADAALETIVRLLRPGEHRGLLDVAVDVDGAQIYLDGALLATSPMKAAASAAVGKRALRVTHGKYRDFLRFVDVRYKGVTRVEVKLSEFPAVRGEVVGRGSHADPEPGPAGPGPAVKPLPWYRRWWAVAILGVVVLGAGTVAAKFALDFRYDREIVVGPPAE